MAGIAVNYAGLAEVHTDLVACWQRIEQLLADLTAAVGATASMKSEALVSYRALAARWEAAAADRQAVLHSLGAAVEQAREHYLDLDRRTATLFLT